MRIVVVGPYPPSADPVADTVLAGVRDLRTGATVVDVVSPVPSAASVTADPTTWRGARRIARVARSADRVVWYAPADARPAFPLRRFLAAGRTLERRAVLAPPPGRDRRGPVRRLRRARAGAPTLVRTVWSRWLRPWRR